MDYLVIGVRSFVGTVFLISSLSKVTGASHREFRASLRAMRLLPESLVAPVAVCVVVAEVAVVGLLATPSQGRPAVVGFTTAGLLLLVFSGAIVVLLRRGGGTSCRCFGSSSDVLARRHVLRNALLAVAAAVGAFASAESHGRPLTWPGVVVVLGIGAALGGLVTVLDDVVALFRPLRGDASGRTEPDAARRPSAGSAPVPSPSEPPVRHRI
ncbi:MauE/DoxX family redox-associated membrane protein [Streptomyces sp. NPDC048057]|uniref:MauE/DoxX family redox-associated membrane protein n=1 Tax=Streptomyces sp. NPDC048057 TaxID=3155628 RepID=UPI0033D9BFDB